MTEPPHPPFSRAMLPADLDNAVLAGRVIGSQGPVTVLVRDGLVLDVSRQFATVSDLLDDASPAKASGQPICTIDELCHVGAPTLLSPIDLQCVKAAGVTFAVSAIERVIEERARGDALAAAVFRGELERKIEGSIRAVVPGSTGAATLKAALIEQGVWSQYLEVAIGPDAEIFTKAPILSTVGWGASIGVRSDSDWNNPEPEVVLIADSAGCARGATLGNDVNLRDFEGRSALLLGKAKDNNASCALGPFIRLFDERFGMDEVRAAEIALTIEGPEGYRLEGKSSMREISRDPEDLLRQTMSQHQYPDGFALFLGTLFAPVQDRDIVGRGFTHKVGDRVTIASPLLGTLVNRVTTCERADPWTFGVRDFMRNLAARNLLQSGEAV